MYHLFRPNLNLFFMSVKETKQENPLPPVKKIPNEITASFLIKFCREN